MSDKPKVYQGVRVKTTVKELLQRHRAREANRKNNKTISQACLELQELSASIFPSRPVEPCPPLTAAPALSTDVNFQMCPTSYLTTETTFPSQIQDTLNNNFQNQIWDIILPANSDVSNHHHNYYQQEQQTQHPQQLHCEQNYQPSVLPLQWSHGMSSDADYYGPGMVTSSPSLMTSSSPTDSLKLCSPDDHSSYSPHDSFSSSSSSSSSCYDSPSRIESTFLSPEPYPYPQNQQQQHYSLQDCYSVGHLWTGQQETFSASEYAPYYNSLDYTYPCPTVENYYRRDLTTEMCYNAL